MNTGVEAGESAIKLARRWAYDVKKARLARLPFWMCFFFWPTPRT